MVPPAEESSAAIHLMETNDPPLEVETPPVHETITKEEARLRVLDENIAHMQSALAALSQKHDESEEKIRLHRAIISPLRRFPPEILGLVFSHTIPPLDELEQDMQSRSFKFGTGLSPWILTRICSRWRSISLSSPSLWTNIVISSAHLDISFFATDPGSWDGDGQPSREYPLDMLRAQLYRSGKAPLRVVIQDHSIPDDTLTTLLRSSPRWLSLKFPKALCPYLSGREVPSLRRIQITGSWISLNNNNALVAPLVAPALHDIRLQTGFTPFTFPWTQITCYQADSTWSKHLDVLPLMVNLLEAHLFITGDGSPGARQVVVPNLRKLYLRGVQHSLIPDDLLLPALEDLFISDGFFWLQHSPCRPKKLAITITDSTVNVVPQHVSDFFQQCPRVTDLIITANVETNVLDIFEALGTTSILPNLQHIAFHFYFDDQMWPFDEFTNFIRSRQTNTANALQSLSLGGPAFSSYPDLAFNSATVTLTLNELKEDGLRVLIDPVTELEEWYTLHGWDPRW